MNTIVNTALENFFPLGRMISPSKSDYDKRHPKNVVVFNANVCTTKHNKIWFGDIDITKDGEKLKELAAALGENVFVLYEMDARFENESEPLFDRARAVVTAEHVDICPRKI